MYEHWDLWNYDEPALADQARDQELQKRALDMQKAMREAVEDEEAIVERRTIRVPEGFSELSEATVVPLRPRSLSAPRPRPDRSGLYTVVGLLVCLAGNIASLFLALVVVIDGDNVVVGGLILMTTSSYWTLASCGVVAYFSRPHNFSIPRRPRCPDSL